MGSSHSKPQKPVRKPQISYPRAQAHSAPLHAYGHSHPSRPHQQQQQQQQQSHHGLHHPAEPQHYGNSPAVHYGKPKLVSMYAPEVKYYGTFPAAPRKKGTPAQGQQQGAVRRKPVAPPSRAQVNYYSKRALPPVPGSRAAVKSVRVQYGYC